MEFNIGKNSTLPLLKMQITDDGKSSINFANTIIENSLIYFSMKDTVNGIPKIQNKKAGFVEKTFNTENDRLEYYIYYKFSSFDTNTVGRYIGEFVLINENGNYILPLRENLYINVLDI
jgi:hypothetical protein